MRAFQFALVATFALGVVWAEDTKETTFNDVAVPPYLELTPENWEEETKKSKWLLVKHFSPYCHHCIDFAPTYQTLYEFYTTSKPGSDGSAQGTFSEYYGFRFAEINCIAYADLCADHDVKSFPTTVLFEDGKAVNTIRGGKSMKDLSNAIEEALEKSRPGSRPKQIALPAPGDNQSPPQIEAPKQTPKAPSKPKVEANPEGRSIALTAETFQRQVTMSQDPWFIKFYAPWCPHCNAMAPTWQQLAKNMRGKLNIGEVNCDVEKRLCKDVKAKAFPTILFFKGGERVEYRGLRGLGDFVQYAGKALELASGVPDVDAKLLEEMEKKEEVIFVYFYDHATTSEDFNALERLPLSLVGHAKLVKTQDPVLYKRYKITTWPRLLVSREGRPTYYPPLTPHEMRDVRGVLEWMKSVWLPLIPELTATNARQIMDNKLVVLGVLDRKDPDSLQGALREMKSAATEWMDRQVQEFQLERKKLRDAKQMRIEEAEDRDDQRALRAAKALHINMDSSNRKEVAFAWVDGVFWQRWIRTTYGVDVKDGERIIINDESNRRYYDNTATGNYILVSRTSIMETLDKIVYGPQVIKPKFTISVIEKFFFDIRVTFVEHTYFSLLCLAGLIFGAISWFRGRIRRRGGHFRLDDSMGINHLKDGLLGGGTNGNQKAD